MKNILNRIQANLGIRSTRTKNITKHVFWSLLFKGGHIIATFMLVPLTIKFLDTENYGIWLTLSSFVAWFTFFDIGLGNGLRNKFAEAKAKGDLSLAKGYVSTAYYTIGCICLGFLTLALLISYNINWANIFNTSLVLEEQLQLLMPIVLGCFSLELVLTLITSIYAADQHHSMQGMISFIVSASSLFIIWILTLTTKSSLLFFGAVFSFLPVLVLFLLNIYAFSTRFKHYKPERSFVKKKYFKEIFSLGVTFFIIQISVLVIFSTDNFIITQLFGPEEVVPYNIAYKYMSISSMLFIILLTPYWSSITDANTKGDIDWIKNSIRNLFKFALLTVLLIVILVLMSPFAYKIWLGDLIVVPFTLTISMAIFFTITVLYAPFNFFINGTGKIKLHMYSFAIGALLNIPLSVVLVKYTVLGVEGVIIATIICVLPNLMLFPIQYSKLINKTANGIWNK